MTRYGLLLLCGALGGAPWALAGPLEDARALAQQNRHAEVYALGGQYPELLGTPEFDYYFGIAAVDAGHIAEGLLALERYVSRYPDAPGAHAELARAYFLAGEDDRAREEFEIVLKAKPETGVRRLVDRYLDLIAARQAHYLAKTALYVEAGYGWDSNSNGGVDDAGINLPVFGHMTVLPSGIKTSSAFAALAAGGQYTRPLTPEWKLFGALGIDDKSNRRHHENNLLETTFATGAEHSLDADTQRLSLVRDVVDVGGTRFRDSAVLGGEWQHRMSDRQALSASTNVGRYAYAGNNGPRDATLTALGMGYRRALQHPWQPLLQLGVSFGREANRKDRPDLGRDIAGLRLAVDVSPTAAWSFGSGISYQDSRYGIDTLLATWRHDRYLAIDAAARYGISRDFGVRGELLLSDNRSNLELNRYKRNVVAVKLRYEFK